MYIEPERSSPAPSPAEPGSDRLRPAGAPDDRAVETPAASEHEEFACVCRIHVETRDGRVCYRLVLERDGEA